MKAVIIKSTLLVVILSVVGPGTTTRVSAHGLMEDPPSRNWLCGAVTKPDEVANGVAEFPVCGEAFADDFNGGYQFMSVLTHDRGRASVRPLPDNVCGFNSETFNEGATPWDAPIDWPATAFAAGRQEIKWNIQWGPHYDDTEEFRYWITKPDFQFQPGRALRWSDFESTEFCALQYNDAAPNANPDVIALKDSSQFRTFCNVPQRQGRHVIYGEWGRNQYTLERFHGCMDVQFNGGYSVPPSTPVEAVESRIRSSASSREVVGATRIRLDASASRGKNLSYVWSVDAPDGSLYQLANANRRVTTLRMADPAAAQSVVVSLLVRNDDGSDSSSFEFVHQPAQPMSELTDLGALTNEARALRPGDTVSIRTVASDGRDTFYPAQPLALTTQTAAATNWPYALALAVNAVDGASIEVGVLNGTTDFNPQLDATANRIYTTDGSGIVSAFLIVTEEPAAPVEPVEPVVPVNPVEPVNPVVPVEPQEPVATPTNNMPDESCTVTIRDGANPWWVGFDVATDASSVTLDFSGTGLDLSRNVNIDSGVFRASVSGQVITLVKPFWVNGSQGGYFGMGADNNAALSDFSAPRCVL